MGLIHLIPHQVDCPNGMFNLRNALDPINPNHDERAIDTNPSTPA
jgi:hypothetical protein